MSDTKDLPVIVEWKQDVKFNRIASCTKCKNTIFIGFLYDMMTNTSIPKFYPEGAPQKCAVEFCGKKSSRIIHLKRDYEGQTYVLRGKQEREQEDGAN